MEESKIEVYIKMIHAKDIVIVISWLTKLLLEGTLKKVCRTNKFNSFDIPIMQRNLVEVHDNYSCYILAQSKG